MQQHEHLFVVGGQRCGSTYLYELLAAHPEVAMAQPVRPEPKFFLRQEKVARGTDHYVNTYFPHRTSTTRYLGEKSTTYIESRAAAERIRAFAPEARIIMVLRDPVSRAWSNYRFSRQNGLETLDFGAALAAEPERLAGASYSTSTNPFAYRQRGRYIDYIDEYLQVFDRAQLKVLVFEELVGSADAVRDLYAWLGIDEHVVPASLDQVVNAAGLREATPHHQLRDLAEGYEAPVAALEQFLGRPLDVWRRQWLQL